MLIFVSTTLKSHKMLSVQEKLCAISLLAPSCYRQSWLQTRHLFCLTTEHPLYQQPRHVLQQLRRRQQSQPHQTHRKGDEGAAKVLSTFRIDLLAVLLLLQQMSWLFIQHMSSLQTHLYGLRQDYHQCLPGPPTPLLFDMIVHDHTWSQMMVFDDIWCMQLCGPCTTNQHITMDNYMRSYSSVWYHVHMIIHSHVIIDDQPRLHMVIHDHIWFMSSLIIRSHHTWTHMIMSDHLSW